MYYPGMIDAARNCAMYVVRFIRWVFRWTRTSNTQRKLALRQWNDRRNDEMHTRRLTLLNRQLEYQKAEQARCEEIDQLKAIWALPTYGSPVSEQPSRPLTNSEIFDELFPPRDPF